MSGPGSAERRRLELHRPETLADAVSAVGDGSVALAGGTEVVPLLRDGLMDAARLVDVRGVVPRGIDGRTIGAGTTLAELEAATGIPDALREACRLSASPQLRNMGTIGGNLLQATRCWYWRLDFPCYLHGGDRCHARSGQHREHAFFGNDLCASAHPSDPAAALLALGATVRTDRRELDLATLYRLPTADDRSTTTLEPGELILELELPEVEASAYLKAMDRKRWAFALVGVGVARIAGQTRVALAGAAPIPWLLEPAALDAATPLPGTTFKVEIARTLVGRALGAIGS
jgi:xanthine dehydrogenase YagS FAD-binding subunit